MLVLTILSWLISDSPRCKGGAGGIWERLKIPLNPPFSKGDLKAFSPGLLPTAVFLPYSSLIHQQAFPSLSPSTPLCQWWVRLSVKGEGIYEGIRMDTERTRRS